MTIHQQLEIIIQSLHLQIFNLKKEVLLLQIILGGKAEHELLSTLQEMTVTMTAYRTKGLDSKTQAIAIINGF